MWSLSVINTRERRVVRVKLVKIGNSRGVRLPAAAIAGVELGDEFELEMHSDGLLLRRVEGPREGWAEAFGSAGATADEAVAAHDDWPEVLPEDLDEWTW